MENKKYYPMTMQQQALADYAAPLQSMELLNEAAYLSFDEAVEETLLQRAVREMIARLPCFRVQMHRGEDGEILQYLSEYVPERIEPIPNRSPGGTALFASACRADRCAAARENAGVQGAARCWRDAGRSSAGMHKTV